MSKEVCINKQYYVVMKYKTGKVDIVGKSNYYPNAISLMNRTVDDINSGAKPHMFNGKLGIDYKVKIIID